MPCKAVFPTSVGAAKVEVDARSFARDSGQQSAESLSDRRGPEAGRRNNPSVWPTTIALQASGGI